MLRSPNSLLYLGFSSSSETTKRTHCRSWERVLVMVLLLSTSTPHRLTYTGPLPPPYFFPLFLWFFFLTQIISHSTRPAPKTEQTHHHQHTHMLTALACTEHHLPMHPLHTCKIITNPRPLLMPYNWVLFVGSLLIWDATSLKWKRCFKRWLAGIYSLKNAKVYIESVPACSAHVEARTANALLLYLYSDFVAFYLPILLLPLV